MLCISYILNAHSRMNALFASTHNDLSFGNQCYALVILQYLLYYHSLHGNHPHETIYFTFISSSSPMRD